jgi:hypothetical protein
MALARIITRSQKCSRDLALDLLARGYTVEIVSPDKVPDNLADLELRIEDGPENQLVANVEAHNGERTASLEFVHHLKSPMGDFVRRPPKLGEAIRVSSESGSFNGTSGFKGVELPVEAPQLTPKVISPATETPLKRELHHRIVPEEVTLTASKVVSSPRVKPAAFVVEDAVENADVPRSSPITLPTHLASAEAAGRSDPFAGWSWRVALTFAGVVLLAVVLAFSARRTGKAGAQASEALPGGTGAASTGVSPMSAVKAENDSARDQSQASVVALPAPAPGSQENSSQAPREAHGAKLPASTANPGTGGLTKPNGLIARDTVTYLDKRFEPAQKTKSAGVPAFRHRRPPAHGDLIAPNTVTYLHRPAPKDTKHE